jgi:hypothetical protein
MFAILSAPIGLSGGPSGLSDVLGDLPAGLIGEPGEPLSAVLLPVGAPYMNGQ